MNTKNSLSLNLQKLFQYVFVIDADVEQRLYKADRNIKGMFESFNLKEKPFYAVIRGLDALVVNFEVYANKKDALTGSKRITRLALQIGALDIIFIENGRRDFLELDYTAIPRIEILPADFPTSDLELIVDISNQSVVIPSLAKYCKQHKVNIYNSLVPISVESEVSFMFALIASEPSIYSIPLKNGVGKFNMFLKESIDSQGFAKDLQKHCKVFDFKDRYIVFSNSNRVSQQDFNMLQNFLVYSNTDTNV